MTPPSRDEARERLAAALVHRLVKFAKAVETASQRERIGLLLDHAHEAADAILALLSPEQGWRDDWENAPQDQALFGIVDDQIRFIRWGKTSHVPFYGWCLADQGAEDFDLCKPSWWLPVTYLPAPPTKGGE